MADVNFEPKRTRGQPTALAGGIQVSYSTVSADRLNRASKFNEFSRNPESGIRDEIRHVAKVKKPFPLANRISDKNGLIFLISCISPTFIGWN